MTKVAIVTDSNAGIHQSENIEGLYILPMPFTIDSDEFFEDVNLSVEEFYTAMQEDKRISTSQPSPGDITELWDQLLEKYDEIVHIPMSSGLSKSYETAAMLARDYNGKVEVVDAKRISVTLRYAVLDALKLADDGMSAEDIKDKLEKYALDSSIYIMVDTLKYLKKGGRISPAVAAIGSLLKIKPILQIQGDKLDSYAKVMNTTQAKQRMIGAIRKDVETRFLEDYKNRKLVINVAHTRCPEKAEEFKNDLIKAFPNIKFGVINELSLSIACHIGPGALAVAVTKKLN